jgi:hypothetical protein
VAEASHITVSNHKNGLWTYRQVSQSWHYNLNEEALDLRTPECQAPGGANCPTAYFRHQGLNQSWAFYTLGNYGGSCIGRTYTVDYWSSVYQQWRPLVKLSFVHLKEGSMRGSSQGQLAPAADYAEWVGVVRETMDPCGSWSGPHLHQARNTNYGVNGHNGATGFGDLNSWVNSEEVVYWANGD